jgi:hypothetical protein
MMSNVRLFFDLTVSVYCALYVFFGVSFYDIPYYSDCFYFDRVYIVISVFPQY